MLRRIRRLAPDGLRLFRDEQLRLEAPGAGPDLHLVVGDSGTGKTTLCQALRLVLYGATPWVSAANASLPLHEATDGPVTATVTADVEAPDARFRVERTLTEATAEPDGDATVGPPTLVRASGDEWTEVEDAAGTLQRLAPPPTESILVNDPGLQRVAQPTGWAPIAQGLLTAAAAARTGADGTSVSPADCWDEFRSRVEAYLGTVGLATDYDVTLDAEPFGVTISGAGDSPAGRASMPTGDTIRFALAMTLAAGDVAELPQWFDAPLGRLEPGGREGAVAGLVAAAERRQVVVLPHQGSLVGVPELRRAAAPEYRLELVDTYRAVVRPGDD